MRNPFETLGISKKMAKTLSDEHLKSLAEGAFRSLIIHAHPDRGGSTEWAQDLNMAHDELADSEKFAKYREEYAAAAIPKREEIDQVREQNARLIDKHEGILGKFFDYASSSVTGAAAKAGTVVDSVISIFNATGARLTILNPKTTSAYVHLTDDERGAITKPFKGAEEEMIKCKDRLAGLDDKKARLKRNIIYLINSIADIKMQKDSNPDRMKELKERLKKRMKEQRYYNKVLKAKTVALRKRIAELAKKYREGTADQLMVARERKREETKMQSNEEFIIKDGGRLVEANGSETGERIIGSLSGFAPGRLENMRQREEVQFLPNSRSTTLSRRPIDSRPSMALTADEFRELLPKLESILVEGNYLVAAKETDQGTHYHIKGRITRVSRPKAQKIKA